METKGLKSTAPITDAEIEILENALELLGFDRPAEVKSAIARLGEKLTALSMAQRAPVDVERVDFYEVDLKVAVSALARAHVTHATEEQRAVLDRLGVKLAGALGQLQHRAALGRPSAPISLVDVAEAVAASTGPGANGCARQPWCSGPAGHFERDGSPCSPRMLADGSVVS